MKTLLGTQHTIEWIVLGATLVVGLATVTMATGYGIAADPGVGAGFLPLVGGLGMILGGAMWAIQLVRAPRTTAIEPELQLEPATSAAVAFLSSDNEEDADETELPDRAGWIRIGVVVAAIAGAALVLPTLGYTLSMALMLAVVLTFVGKRTPLVAIGVAVATTLATRLVFDVWLGTALPASSISFLADWGL
ncbi:tripartite tricarboxylate transporter TctB family protein [Rhodococcus sp. IEGM 1330]|uniref:tripartite tricarboxylate transporter TctB family protein n=1 Tax=Rhodococcus sp. IEGM 1330 TaxID=3082225 RepID=UPI002953B0AB|nr:tripartite tricarboxylate transporter TctB family protein [Rhodococcus sp. IEGM 1330]MDV8025226.1 tripartite tricarboxylate transporter TctB family protein [Rhodococcus sp. IEGM 1330]